MTLEKVKVLYIAGMGRSGSTILGRLLGELPNAVNVGEIDLFSISRLKTDARCECLEKVVDCVFWEAVFEKAFGGLDTLDWAELQQTRSKYRLRTLPSLLLPKTPQQTKRLEDYLSVLSTLYTAIREVSNANVIVDGSKSAFYGYLLNQVSTIELHRVHLIRDSRAVAFSYQRIKKDPPLVPNPGQLSRYAPWQTALSWNAVTLALASTRNPRCLPLRYEDFIADPQETIHRLWDLVGEPIPSLDFLETSPLILQRGHTVAGNPDRFRSEVVLKPDLEWQSRMKPADRRLVTAMTFPLLLRYGYFSRRQSANAGQRIQPSRVL